MLSYEQNNINSEPTIRSTDPLNQKLENYTNKLLESIHRKDQSVDTSWVVFDLSGKILATGATPTRNEKSEFLF
jgi:hypothetical protein